MSAKVIRVVAAIIKKDKQIFATQRGYGEYKDWWEFFTYDRNRQKQEFRRNSRDYHNDGTSAVFFE